MISQLITQFRQILHVHITLSYTEQCTYSKIKYVLLLYYYGQVYYDQ